MTSDRAERRRWYKERALALARERERRRLRRLQRAEALAQPILAQGPPAILGGLLLADAAPALNDAQGQRLWLYEAGMSAHAIAYLQGVNPSSVRRSLIRAEYRVEVARLAAGLPLLEAAA